MNVTFFFRRLQVWLQVWLHWSYEDKSKWHGSLRFQGLWLDNKGSEAMFMNMEWWALASKGFLHWHCGDAANQLQSWTWWKNSLCNVVYFALLVAEMRRCIRENPLSKPYWQRIHLGVTTCYYYYPRWIHYIGDSASMNWGIANQAGPWIFQIQTRHCFQGFMLRKMSHDCWTCVYIPSGYLT